MLAHFVTETSHGRRRGIRRDDAIRAQPANAFKICLAMDLQLQWELNPIPSPDRRAPGTTAQAFWLLPSKASRRDSAETCDPLQNWLNTAARLNAKKPNKT